jgi:hypothetical protein
MNSGLSDRPFAWQQGYGAQTVSKQDLDRVIAYVRNQKKRHGNDTTVSDLEHSDLIPDDDQ